MGNLCTHATQGGDTGTELSMAKAINVRQANQKVYVQSNRFSRIYSSKKRDNKEEFILRIKPYDDLEHEEAVQVELEAKQDNLYSLAGAQYDFEFLEDLSVDPNAQGPPDELLEENLYCRARDKRTNEPYMVKVVNFQDYEDYEFKQAIYEIAVRKRLAEKPHANIIQLKDAYLLQSEKRTDKGKSVVIVLEHSEATLHEIIAFRSQHRWEFPEECLCASMRDLADALSYIHSLGIVHRDLRPASIWYVASEKTYKIGTFTEAKIVENFKPENAAAAIPDPYFQLNTTRGAPQFMSPEIIKAALPENFTRDENAPFEKVVHYNAFKQDIYSLGLLLSMMRGLQLEVSFELQYRLASNKDQIHVQMGNWDLSSLVNSCLAFDANKRPTAQALAEQTLAKYPLSEYPSPNEQHLTQSLKFKKQKQDQETYLKNQKIISHQYYKLFDMEGFRNKHEGILKEHEGKTNLSGKDHQKNEQNKAIALQKMGECHLQHNDLYLAKDYFLRASVYYNELGNSANETSNVEDALKHYENAIDCVRKAYNGENSVELALLLENIGNVYKDSGDIQKAKALLEESLDMIAHFKGENSPEVARLLNTLGHAYCQLGKYKQAEQRIKTALKICEKLYLEEGQKEALQALCLCNLGEVNRSKGNRNKAKKFLLESLAMLEKTFGSGHIEVAGNVENLGNVYYDDADYHNARQQYERALVIKKSKFSRDSPEIAQTLTNIGNTCRMMKEYQKSKKCYQDAEDIFEKRYGKDSNNFQLAFTLGNHGLTLAEEEKYPEALQKLEQCLKILYNSFGDEHPDFLFFQKHYHEIEDQSHNQLRH